eukprot:scaffold1874_cov237-Pinguiococcus_pyrenoidosus.AAC.2
MLGTAERAVCTRPTLRVPFSCADLSWILSRLSPFARWCFSALSRRPDGATTLRTAETAAPTQRWAGVFLEVNKSRRRRRRAGSSFPTHPDMNTRMSIPGISHFRHGVAGSHQRSGVGMRPHAALLVRLVFDAVALLPKRGEEGLSQHEDLVEGDVS